MSLHFCNATFEGDKLLKIEALTGARSIVLSDMIVDDILLNLGKVDTSELLKTYYALVANDRRAEVKEEFSHYRILSNSRIALVFSIWNYLLRVRYTKLCARVDAGNDFIESVAHVHPLLSSYYTYYSVFYSVASPVLEAYYAVLDSTKVPSDVMFFDDKTQKVYFEMKKKDEDDLIGISQALDKLFLDELSSSRYSAKLSMLHEVFKVCNSVETCLHVLKKFVKLFNVFGPFLSNRLIKKDDPIGVGKLPTITDGKRFIDPFGFPSGNYTLGSQEPKYHEYRRKRNANFYWHIVSRCYSTYSLLLLGCEYSDILLYFKKLRVFFGRCIKASPEASNEFSKLDNKILLEIFESFMFAEPQKNILDLNDDESICQLCTDVYLDNLGVVQECFDDVQFHSLMGFSYLHI